MKTWHYALSGSHRESAPESALASLVSGGLLKPDTLVWSDGMPAWLPAREALPTIFAAEIVAGPPPLPSSAPARRSSHEIDFDIHGDDLQMVEIELDPGETVIAEAGGMCFMEE